MIKCHKCRSTDLRWSRLRVWELPLAWLHIRAYRCRCCFYRDYLLPRGIQLRLRICLRLSGNRWMPASQASSRHRSPGGDVRTLFVSLKKLVRSAPGARMVTLQALAYESGLSEAWIYHAIEDKLIEARLHRKGATWARGFEGAMIYVPIRFGRGRMSVPMWRTEDAPLFEPAGSAAPRL